MDAIELIYTRYPTSLCGPAKAVRGPLESAPHIHHHFRLLAGQLSVLERKACRRPGAAIAAELSRRHPLATERSPAGEGEKPLQVEADTGAPKPRSPRSPEHFLGHWHAAVPA